MSRSTSENAKRYRTMRETLGAEHPDTREAGSKRLAEVLDTERSHPRHGLWWLSFTDPARPLGSQFLGVAIVEAIGHSDAVTKAWTLGVNPGGEVASFGDPLSLDAIAPEWRNRLLTREEAESIQL